jgi:general secretion pathway protein C
MGLKAVGLNHNRLMIARVAAFLLWAFAAGSAVFWGLRLAAQPLPVPAQAVPATAQVGSASAVTRMLGSTAAPSVAAAPPPASSRFKLIGALAPVRSGAGPAVALIAVDGKPARAYALGARVEGELVLQSVSQRSADLGPAGGQAAFTLEVPRLPLPQTGVLPAAENGEPPDEGAGPPSRPAGAPRSLPPPAPPAVAPTVPGSPVPGQQPARQGAAAQPGTQQVPRAVPPQPAMPGAPMPAQPVPATPARPQGSTPGTRPQPKNTY